MLRRHARWASVVNDGPDGGRGGGFMQTGQTARSNDAFRAGCDGRHCESQS